MTPFRLFGLCHAWLTPRRRGLYLVSLVLLGLCATSLWSLRVREDVSDMLPASAELRHSLSLMEMAPFARTLFIELRMRSDTVDGEALLRAAKDVSAGLLPPRFTAVLPDGMTLPGPTDLMALLPSLVDAADVAALEARLDPEAVRRRMAGNYSALLGMNGLLAKHFIQADPLGFLEVLLAKINGLRMFDGARLRDGFLVRPDGRALLMLLKTDVPVTDAGRSEVLMGEVEAALARLPADVTATVVSGHRYALANAGTIKADLRRVFAVSGLGLLLIFGIFIRSRDVVWIALLPGAVLLIATAVLAWCYDAVSGVTLGFGAVLLGITVDFALHVWFAMRHAGVPPGQAVARVARPVLYGAATSMGAFLALATSDIPGIRQLAAFALAGLAAGLLLALLVLPHLLRPGALRPATPRRLVDGRWNLPLALLTAVVLLAGLCSGSGVGMNRQLRAVGMVTEDLRRDERQLRENWGGTRDQAVLFAEGDTLDEALQRNHQVARLLAAKLPDDHPLSLDLLWPPAEVQQANRARWSQFVARHAPAIDAALTVGPAAYGFSGQAFAPFSRFLQTPPGPLDAAAVERAGLGALSAMLQARHQGRHYLLTLLPDEPRVHELAAAGVLPQGVTLVSSRRLGALLGQALSKDFVMFVAVACGSMFLLLLLFFRRVGFALLAMAPLLGGLVGVLLMLRLGGGAFNMFNVAALPLVIGLGADYGIFMVCRARSGQDHGTARAVLVSGLTTVVGFGALVMARHPALHTLGLTVLVGVGVAIPMALLLVPALYRRTA